MPRRERTWRRAARGAAATGVLAGLSAGCLLFVEDPSNLSTTCRFRGDDTVCGRCLAARCAAELAECCRSSHCGASLDECGGRPNCGLSSEIAECARSACRDCESGALPDASKPTTTDCSQGGDSCRCSVDGTPNSVVCGEANVPAALCCADYGWPRPGFSCRCETFSCAPAKSGGHCSLSARSTGTTTWSGSGCCTDRSNYCDCDSAYPCSATTVESCRVSEMRCSSSQIRVESCSF